GRGQPRPVRLDRHLKPESTEYVHQIVVKLEQGFAPGTHHQWARSWGSRRRPFCGNRVREFSTRAKPPTPVAVYPHEIRTAEPTDGRFPLLIHPRPEIASGKSAEDGGASRLGPFPLERIEDLFDGVCHEPTVTAVRYTIGSLTPLSRNPLSRRKHASHIPHASP